MKLFSRLMFCLTAAIVFFGVGHLSAAENANSIGIVNFKLCVEKSKQGQQEKNAFESLKKQMSAMLEKADKELEEISKKLEDQDYMDGLSPAAEEELKQKYQALSQDYARYHNQYSQMISQANYKVIQNLTVYVSKASETVAKARGLYLVLHDDSAFYYDSSLDISQDVIKEMDRRYEMEHGDQNPPAQSNPK